MNVPVIITAIVNGLTGVLGVDDRAWKRLTGLVARLFRRPSHTTSYENLSLSIELELCDATGELAIVRRTQRVRFLTEESGVVRDVVWGEGEPLAGYRVTGAELLSVRREGSKRVVLLGLPANPGKGEETTVRTDRTIRGGFRPDEAYLEALVERPTKALKMSVVFPRERLPKRVRVEASPPAIPTRALKPRLDQAGQARASWSVSDPKNLVTYRLRWTW